MALARLEHAEVLITQKDELIMSKDQTIQGQAQIISLKDGQLTEKDKQITALQNQNQLLTQSNEDCKTDRLRITGERDSAKKQNWLFAAAGAALIAILKGSN